MAAWRAGTATADNSANMATSGQDKNELSLSLTSSKVILFLRGLGSDF